MPDEPRYTDELRLPISITLSGPMVRNGQPWPTAGQEGEWPGRRGQPSNPLHQMPPGQGPGTGAIGESGDVRSPSAQFADIDRAMAEELARARQASGRPRATTVSMPAPAIARSDAQHAADGTTSAEPNRALFERGLASSPRADAATIPQDDASHLTGTPLLDRSGQPVTKASGGVAETPAAFSTDFFYKRGKEDADQYKEAVSLWKAAEQNAASPGDPTAGIASMMASNLIETGIEAKLARTPLANFGQQHVWDAQRHQDPKVIEKFREAASIYIGVYGAAAGIPEPMLQKIQNDYAALHSGFKDQKMSETYKISQRSMFKTCRRAIK